MLRKRNFYIQRKWRAKGLIITLWFSFHIGLDFGCENEKFVEIIRFVYFYSPKKTKTRESKNVRKRLKPHARENYETIFAWLSTLRHFVPDLKEAWSDSKQAFKRWTTLGENSSRRKLLGEKPGDDNLLIQFHFFSVWRKILNLKVLQNILKKFQCEANV